MTFVLILPLIIIAALVIEMQWHKSMIQRIPLRISINGTRGKSSTTQYIVAGLRAAGKRPLGKITGTEPLLLKPDGKSERIRRWGKPRIQEQMKVVYRAAQEGVDVLVAECMAVSPEYQLIDARIISPQIYVITNILDDHREQYGGKLDLYAESICSAIPSNAIVVTSEQTYLPFIKGVADIRNTRVIVAQTSRNVDFHPEIFLSNLDMAVEVCKLVGVDPEIAKNGILRRVDTSDDPDNKKLRHGLRLINGLAVNDTVSAQKLLNRWRSKGEGTTILLHTRNDRPLRTLQFSEWIASLSNIDKVLLSGSHTFIARRSLQKMGVSGDTIIEMEANSISMLTRGSIKDSTIYGFGNTGDGGIAMWHELERVLATPQV